jgi:putative membrane protein
MESFIDFRVAEIVSTVFYTFLGVVLMGVCWWAINRFTHFSVIREIEEDQNVALAVLIGSVFLSLALIISAVILS